MSVFDLPTNLTLIPQIFVVADSFTQGILGLAILIIIFFGTLFLTSAFSTGDSLIATSFITMVMAIFLKYLNLLSDFFMFLSAIFFIIALVMSAVKKSQPGA